MERKREECGKRMAGERERDAWLLSVGEEVRPNLLFRIRSKVAQGVVVVREKRCECMYV